MASTKNQKAKPSTGTTKAGPKSHSRGRNTGKNRNTTAGSMLGPVSRGADTSAVKTACTNAILELRKKLTSEKSAELLNIAVFMLEQRSTARGVQDPITRKWRSAYIVAEATTYSAFRAQHVREALIAYGIRAANLEFDAQYEDLQSSRLRAA